MTDHATTGKPSAALRRVLIPLALAQFICSFAGSNMNVMINDMSEDLDTTVQGIQMAITLFLLVMAALMIPGGKLTDRYGRKRLFTLGLIVYGIGALLSAVSPGLGMLILGNSILEGVGTALLIPPVYILATLLFTGDDVAGPRVRRDHGGGRHRRRSRTAHRRPHHLRISWRGAFVFQALIIALIVLLSRHVEDPLPADPTRPFDTGGAVLSSVGLVLLVCGILAADDNLWLMLGLLVAGALVLVWFFLSVRAKEREGKEPLLSTEPVPQPHVQPRPDHPEHPVAGAHGGLVHGRGLPAGRARLRRDRDRRDLHRGHCGPAAYVARRRAVREAAGPAEPHHGRLRPHDRRHRGLPRHGERFPERLGLRTRAVRHRPGDRHSC